MNRVVVPEILDELPHDDPEAIRSRGDLRRINALMRNHAWMRDQLHSICDQTIVELGAGDGGLLASLRKRGGRLIGLDLTPRPAELPEPVEWIPGDLFETLPNVLTHSIGPTTVVANLFLHHFESEALARLGTMLDRAEAIFISEPHRSRLPLYQSFLLLPFVNRVTRHDMPVSIRAGFRRGELPRLLELGAKRWEICERINGLGAYRLSARRR